MKTSTHAAPPVDLDRLVRLSYPASEKMVIILPIETRQVMDTSGDIFPARLMRASGIGSGGIGEGRYQLGVKLRRGIHSLPNSQVDQSKDLI